MSVHHLASVTLPDAFPLRRDPPQTSEILNADSFWANYDSRTLIYDCVYAPSRRTLTLYTPKAYNLKSLFDQATFKLDSQPLNHGRWITSRHLDMLRFSDVQAGQNLHCVFPNFSTNVRINTTDITLARRNALYTMSRDNDLSWIADWAAFHQKMHGADAIVLCDNGSESYTPAQIDEALAQVPGFKAIRVVAAPLPFGPRAGDCTKWSNAKFLQAAMMNLCKDRFLSRARVILNLDVDELAVSTTGESIFDATAASRFGHITFPGYWRHATADAPRHRDHIYIQPNESHCPTKYTLRPDSFLARFPMHVHSLSKINRKLFLQPKRFHFLHCRSISTSWKVDRSPDTVRALTADPDAQQIFKTAFGANT